MDIEVRPATADDSAALVTLIAAMGYDVTAEEVAQRLAELAEGDAVFVAVAAGRVRGWCHVYRSQSLIAGPRAEIAGLAVNPDFQGGGVGGALLRQVEEWAAANGIPVVHLRSGSEREAAHEFYRKHGYNGVKTQLALRKSLV
ncbi:GNAT family N-acetyltransferase [Symbioplanes lichenis]|uniref:GNAT family N-acetyltransferase n=1 Tax=Symbioplanes lichenis TaxID=1629072 RepID=UPI00273844F6|nr:GNAT family N-acetyltransferase [Actinoplanes lichenis]